MFKHKKFLFLSLILPVFSLFSCGEPQNEKYKFTQDPYAFAITIDKKTYNYNEKLVIDKVEYGKEGEKKVGLEQIFDQNKITEENTYFICTNNEHPYNSFISKLTFDTNTERSEIKFYICHYVSEDSMIHISGQQTIVVINNDAIKPWVWFVVTGVVIFGVVGMVFYTKRRKEKLTK